VNKIAKFIDATTLRFDESKCKFIGEIDHDMPASQFKESGLKRKVSVKNSSLKKLKSESARMIISVDFFFPKVKNHVMSCMLNARFEMFNIAISVWLLQNYRMIYKTNTAFIRTNIYHNFSSNSTNICANKKIPPFISSE